MRFASSELQKLMPSLKAFAVSLTGDDDLADDLVQETVCRALVHHAQFQEGSNLRAWMFVILRNAFYSVYRKRKRQTDSFEVAAAKLSERPIQLDRLMWTAFEHAFMSLPPKQRNILIAVGFEGLTYEQAGNAFGVPVGTAKSRIHRARTRLATALGFQDPREVFCDDHPWSSITHEPS